MPGHKGVEIRCAGVDTGNTAFTRLDLGADNFILGIGDDTIDKDPLSKLPERGNRVACALGGLAQYYARECDDVVDLPSTLAATPVPLSC